MRRRSLLGGQLRMRFLTLCLLVCGTLAAQTNSSYEGFDDPALNARYQALIREIRCVQCQNTSIAGSSVALAADLRRQIHRMMEEGASDSEITDYLVTRYGDFVTYRPPLRPNTWALWGFPVVMLLLGGFVFARIARNRAGQPIQDDDVEDVADATADGDSPR